MVAATALLHKPTFTPSLSYPSNPRTFTPTLLLRLPASSFGFFGGVVSKKRVSKTSMTELVKTYAFRDGDGEKSVKMLQQEALVKEPSGFPSQFTPEGLERTLNRLSKWFVSFLFGAVILWRHDAESMWIAMGSVLNALLSVTLKRIFNQERPFPSANSEPGMPSSHAQSIFYTVVFSILSELQIKRNLHHMMTKLLPPGRKTIISKRGTIFQDIHKSPGVFCPSPLHISNSSKYHEFDKACGC
ncbi:lipid phosphate phosphatase epsilon 2, chloroplastic isoform X3 [Manihot esculenta]|uniref:lipid phosphate phosphatase epsilon 2, chloroplastic isoform X3 n=1 Tax=Manihot esculenta TaxID=3983 RepID=UPI001CC56AAE|nr:lipid phosphate phosphatase epsilon 2, chloroplastic isoform X3 [Manihot esculenta]